MIMQSDWHIHSEYSYDAANSLEEIGEGAKAQGLRRIGITDHANFNDPQFLGDLRASAEGVKKAQEKYPFMILGVELTPIPKPEFDYLAIHHTHDGFVPPIQDTPYDIELAASKEELMALGVRYAIGAAHWRVDLPGGKDMEPDMDACIKEWFRQQMYLACDERVTILGHPWWSGKCLWYEDFSVIPKSMNEELAAALKENGKYVECNAHFFRHPKSAEKFRHQYAEFLRELFEKGIPVTYGSDSHRNFKDLRQDLDPYLREVGFSDGDFSEISEEKLWL